MAEPGAQAPSMDVTALVFFFFYPEHFLPII